MRPAQVSDDRLHLNSTNRNELTGVTRYSDVGGTSLAGTATYVYDDASRVTAMTNYSAAGATLSYYNYALDNANRVTQETWGSLGSPGTHVYSYDNGNQLTNADGLAYAYTPNGNRTQVGTFTYQTGTSNRILNDGTYTYTYDAEGNRLTRSKGADVTTYTYDARNLMTGVLETLNGVTQLQVTYTYDALG